MTIRRILLIALAHFIVMVCFPYYGGGGFVFGLVSLVAWSAAAILAAVISAVLFLDKWAKFNALLSALIFFGALGTMLFYFPQENNISPVKKLSYGDLPSGKEINKGLGNFGIHLSGAVDWVKDAKGSAKKLRSGSQKMQNALEELQ